MSDKNIIPNTESDKVVMVGQNQQAFQEVKWQIKPHRGHIVFEISMDTGDIVPAKFEEVNIQINDFGPQVNIHLQAAVIGKAIPNREIKKKLITKHNCVYISALNIRSASKKFGRDVSGKWWNEIPYDERIHICQLYYPDKTPDTIEKKQILQLWLLEQSQK